MRIWHVWALAATLAASVAPSAQQGGTPTPERDFLSRVRRLTVEGKRAGEGHFFAPFVQEFTFEDQTFLVRERSGLAHHRSAPVGGRGGSSGRGALVLDTEAKRADSPACGIRLLCTAYMPSSRRCKPTDNVSYARY